ncbi:MAG: hypothetical protein DRH06_00330 [Deltaproteobacteria bacterium]|nr:MAG: hypothetical protein DRH06_00330 [Deltaproteobacteria bacterium]
MNLFEKASKNKLRIATTKGFLSVEDLWDLPLTSQTTSSLDSIARDLSKLVKEGEEESFVTETSKASEDVVALFDIVKHIIAIRLEENKKIRDASRRKHQKQAILAIMADKQTDELKGKSLSELQDLVDAL